MVEAYAPGRVNLIGDHTDYTGGLALPMAIDLGTTVSGRRGGDRVLVDSADLAGTASVPLHDAAGSDDRTDAPSPGDWTAYVRAVVDEVRPERGFEGRVTTTLPIGGGLSSSAALEVAVALALGATGSPLELARLCQRAEQRASGVPCGIMDQLASLSGVPDHALLMDFTTLAVEPVPVPGDARIVVVHSGEARTLAGSAYADRRAQCELAAREIGPLHQASPGDVTRIADPVLRRRARHVVSENRRVRSFASALGADDLSLAGRLMDESHASLRDDFEVSTPALDALVERLRMSPHVLGARLTGAGFGGCVVALAAGGVPEEGRTVRPSAGARVTDG